MADPQVSLIVVVRDMARTLPRTLDALSAPYQRHIAADAFEVLVVDNGSALPVDEKIIARPSGNFRLIRVNPAALSPARAINLGVAAARGNVIGVMSDAAYIVTPGLLHFARHGVQLYPRAVVATLGWQLGHDQQKWSVEGGYNKRREDTLLSSIDWPAGGYRLFEIGTPDDGSLDGWLGLIAEPRILFMSRMSWDLLGGVDDRFDLPGGGLLHVDTFTRALELPGSELVILLGEGAFRQIHDGASGQAPDADCTESAAQATNQYRAIRGRVAASARLVQRTYLGSLPRVALLHFARSAIEPVGLPPLGETFDPALWSLAPLPRPAEATVAALLDLAEQEFRARRFAAAAAVARIARGHAPDEPTLQRLLATTGAWLRGSGKPPDVQRASFHVARAKAFYLLGDIPSTEAEMREALTCEPNLPEAHMLLASLRLPGEGYYQWLERLHGWLLPRTYLEIGVLQGESLRLARPPTRVIGIDPAPRLAKPLAAETHLFCQRSDTFFASGQLRAFLQDGPLDLAFIDGSHLMEDVLNDFMHLEAYCGNKSAIMLHDTIPLNDETQQRQRTTAFYTGDVWKVVLCLKHYRPDLSIFTIATPPSGLTIVSGLDPTSRVLAERRDEIIKQFVGIEFAEVAATLREGLNVVPNDVEAVKARLGAAGLIAAVAS